MITPITPKQRETLAGRIVVASISGGKDSAAMSLWLTENGVEHRRVFANTGWEHTDTYHYVHETLPKYLGPIDQVVGDDGGMVPLIQRKGRFPSRMHRFCTSELKVKPIAAYIRSLLVPVVNAIGIRGEESAARASQPEWEPADDIYGEDVIVWRPMLSWTLDDVIAIHKRHGVPPNPLYLKGADRVGCWPCIFARKGEIRNIADMTPERIDLIRELEAEVTQKAIDRAALKGETLESRGHSNPAWFQAQGSMRKEGRDGRCVPIDEVVAWSRTARGGKQTEMFSALPEDTGCVRWGLCESATDSKNDMEAA